MKHAAWLLALCQIAVWVVLAIVISAGSHPLLAEDRSAAPALSPELPRDSAPEALLPETPSLATPQPASVLHHAGAAGVVEVEAYRIARGVTAVRRGCGVLITRKGHVFVPLPVIEGADALIITFSDGLRSPVRRLAEDGHNQLALVKSLVLPEHPVPLTLSEQAYPGPGSRLTLLSPGEPVLSTGSGTRVTPAADGADRAYAVPVPAGSKPDGGALVDGSGELAGLVLGSTASADGSADRRLLVLPAAEIRNSVERILHGNPGTLLERLADAPTL